jgi:filamentous hemagglutinin family protein
MTKTRMHPRHPGNLKPLCYALLLSFVTAAQANPTAPTVVNGSVQFNQAGSTLNVINSPSAIINWQSFSIGAGETTRFIQQSASSAVLNRVVGQNMSSLLGTLESNGQVWLINPSGILIGRDAQINVGGLVASTLDVMDGDFLGGRMNFNGDTSAVLENQGRITVPIGGGVYLLGGEVENSGVITAPSGEVVLAAGKQIEIGHTGTPNLSVNIKAGEGKALNLGQIATPDGSTNIFAALIEQKGVINAGSAVREGGRILLRASKQVKLDSGSETKAESVGNTGGDIRIEAGFVALGGTISADGAAGGNITVDASGGLSLAENVSARGLGGNGGRVSYHSGGQTLETSTSHTDVSGATNGGRIRIDADGGLLSSGDYSAQGNTGAGGRVDISGDYVRLFGSQIDASGQTLGGLVRIGGAFQGGKTQPDSSAQSIAFVERWGELDAIANSARTFINDSTHIDVSARDGSKHGGTAIVWSDLQTTFLGGVTAPGGAVEISSAGDLRHVNLNALDLAGGQLLLDPKNIVIGDYSTASSWTWQALMGSGYTGAKNVSLSNIDTGEERNDQFGTSVALNDAGDRLAVGAYGDDGLGNDAINAGAVYLFSFTDSDFSGGTLQAILGKGYSGGKNINIGNLETGDYFGSSVSLNANGNRLAVGATYDAGADNGVVNAGAVYLFSFTDTSFSGGAVEGVIGRGYTGGKNLSLPGLETGDSLGNAVSLNAAGDRLAVGAENDAGPSNATQNSGAVYLFSFSDGNFSNPSLVSTIGKGYSGGSNFNVTNLEAGDYFGVGVALNAAGDRLIVGAPFDQGFANGSGTDTGAVYLFSFADSHFGTPTLQGIVGSGYTGGNNLNVTSLQSGDMFGWSVDLANNRIAVGAPGDDGSGWHDTNGGAPGAVYLFSTDSNFTNTTQQAILGWRYSGGKNLNLPNLSDGNEDGDFFGGAVALNANADRLVVGAPGADAVAGAVYAFTFTDTSFSGGQQAALIGHDSVGGKNVAVDNLEGIGYFNGDMFGMRVALNANADRLAVGAPGDDGANNDYRDTGAVYLFSFSDSDWNDATLQSIVGKGYSGGNNIDVGNLDNGDGFGFSVALNAAGDRLGVGAPWDDGFGNSGNNFGAVYVFSFTDTMFSSGTLEALAGKGHIGDINALDPEDNFGWSLAFNASNDRMAVGAPGDDGHNNLDTPDAGAVYLFSFSNSTFSDGTQEAIIGSGYSVGKNIHVNDLGRSQFGMSVSLNATGDRLAIGSEDDGVGDNAGAVHLFSFTDSSFSDGNREAILGRGFSGGKNFDVTNAEDDDSFGWSVSLNAAGDRLAVGAPFDDGNGNSQDDIGAVYLFGFSDTLFSETTQLAVIGDSYSGGSNLATNSYSHSGELFGTGVALNATGNRLAVGAPFAEDPSYIDISGATRLFSFTDTDFSGGTLQSKLGTGYTGAKDLDLRAYLDRKAFDIDLFGMATTLNGVGDRLAIGTPTDDGADNTTADAGAVYLFSFDDANFNGGQLAGIIGKGYTGGKNVDVTALQGGDVFGASVALNSAGNRLAVGALGDDGSGNSVGNSGAVYLFSFSDNSFNDGTLQATVGAGYSGGKNIHVAGLEQSDRFNQVALNAAGDRLAVGADGDDGAGNGFHNAGAVYLFSFTDNSLFSGGVQEAIIGKGYAGGKNVDIAQIRVQDEFGQNVALNGIGDRLAVGANYHAGFSGTQHDSGAVFLYSFSDTFFSGGILEGVIGHGYTGINDFDTSTLSTENLGSSVAMNTAGNRLAVGVSDDDGFANNTDDAGAVFLFSFSNGSFSNASLDGRIGVGYTGSSKDIDMTGRLEAGDEFGVVAMNGNGDRLAVGYEGDGEGVHLFTFTDSNFSGGRYQGAVGANLTASGIDAAGIGSGDGFGSSLALSATGDRMAIGAPFDDGAGDSASDSGAVYLYSFTNGDFGGAQLESVIGKGYSGGKNIDVLTLNVDDWFGWSVALNAGGNRLAVSAAQDDGFGDAYVDAGAVYLFSFADTDFSGGALSAMIGSGYVGPLDFDTSGAIPNQLGNALAFNASGDRLAISGADDGFGGALGANIGAVHLFSFSDSNFSDANLEGTIGRGYTGGKNLDVSNLETEDWFGQSLAFNAAGDRLAVGADTDGGFGNSAIDSGAVYLFSFTDTTFGGGTLEAIIGKGYSGGKNIDVANLEADDWFGNSVALNATGDRLAVGASRDAGFGNTAPDSGAVYLFDFSDTSFSSGSLQGILGKGYTGNGNLDVSALEAGDRFGTSIAFNVLGNRLAIGASEDAGLDNGNPGAGAVHLFTALGSGSSVGNLAYGSRSGETVNIDADDLATLLSTGVDVTLQASNDITLEAGNDINVFNGSGNGGALGLHAGRSILLNADIVTDNGNLTLLANDTLANGVVDADREAGNAVIQMATGTSIDAGAGAINITLTNGAGITNLDSGDIELANLSGNSVLVVNDGASAGSDIVFSGLVTMNQSLQAEAETNGGIVLLSGASLNAGSTGTALQLSGQTFSNAAGASALETPAGRWLVLSGNPANDVLGGLAADFKRYNCFLGSGCLTPGVTIPGAGNGFLYTIAPVITLTADAQSKTYGEADPALTYQASGFIDGDTSALLTGALSRATGSLSSGGFENIGSYAINQGTLASDLGYSVSYTGANLTINPLALNVSGQTVDNKVYDGGVSATTTGGSLNGTLTGDAVGFSTLASFIDKNVGNGKGVALDFTLSGADVGNYTLADAGDSADITAKLIDVSGIVAQDKVYDATTVATLDTSAAALVGTIGGDLISLDFTGATGTFATKNVGTALNVAVNGLTLTGSDAGNYALNFYSDTADITAKAISATGILAQDKVYDATTAATLNTAAAGLSGVSGGDTVNLDITGIGASFADKHVGSAKSVSVSGLALSGADMGNYTLNSFSDTADITPLTINATGILAQDKIYDATTIAMLNTTTAALSAVIVGDTVSLNSASASGSFANQDVGTAKSVSISGLVLNGADAGNYTLNAYSDSADISPRSLQVDLVGGISKIYDGNITAPVLADNLQWVGVQGSDSLGLTLSSASFDTTNVGTSKTVTASWASNGLTGAAASNYQLLNFSANADIGIITPATLTYVADLVDLVYGQAFPTTFNGEVTGFVGGETLNSATSGSLSWYSQAMHSDGPGEYAILGEGLSALNYVFAQAASNLAALRITPANTPEANEIKLSLTSLIEKALSLSTDSTETGGTLGGGIESDVSTLVTPGITTPAESNSVDPITTLARSDSGLTVNSASGVARDDLSALLLERKEFKTELFQTALESLDKDPKLAEVRVCTGNSAEAASGTCMSLKSAKPGKRANLRQPKSASLPQIERKIALMIGINDYTSGIPKLEGAIPDAVAVGALLENRLGYETRVLRDASKQDIVRAMNELADELDSNDSVTVYYAGHGYQDERTRRGYWIPRDGAADNPTNWLSNQDVARMLANLPAGQVMLVSDSCFSGTFTKEQTLGGKGGALGGKSLKAEDLLAKRSVIVMSSGGEEPVADQGRNGHSIFAWHLMETLRNVEQWSIGANLFDVVRDNVAKEFPQTPHYGASLSAGHNYGGDYIFELRSY